jgi:Fe2+ transport system protein FeoA
MHAGEEGRIVEIDGPPDIVVRLREMGLQPGLSIRMVREGSPCIVAFDNHRLSLRAGTETVVLVEVEGDSRERDTTQPN